MDMLHAFEDSTGEELWGFVPTDLLGSLKNLTTGASHPYYADASPRTFIKDANGNGTISAGEGDKVVLIFGERRGGSAYFALDVTTPESPSILWRIGAAITDTEPDVGSVWDDTELGQSWSEPEITRVVIGGEAKYIFLTGGGYDTLSEDVVPRVADAVKGRAVYAVDVLTGTKLWEYSYTTSTGLNDPSDSKHDMTYAIPASLTVIDSDGNGYADRAYVGDAGGQLWRLDIGNHSTENLLQASSSSSSDIASMLSSLSSNKGWYIKLDQHDGEKVLAPASVFAKVAYYTTFSPTGGEELDACIPNRGVARVFALNYLTGEAVFNYDTSNDSGYSTETNTRAMGNDGEILNG